MNQLFNKPLAARHATGCSFGNIKQQCTHTHTHTHTIHTHTHTHTHTQYTHTHTHTQYTHSHTHTLNTHTLNTHTHTHTQYTHTHTAVKELYFYSNTSCARMVGARAGPLSMTVLIGRTLEKPQKTSIITRPTAGLSTH